MVGRLRSKKYRENAKRWRRVRQTKDIAGREIRTSNPHEQEFIDREAAKRGWEVMRRGWPDFLCLTKNGAKLIAVEVKRPGATHVKDEQRVVMELLAQHGIDCYLWTPDRGFTPIEKVGKAEMA